MNQEPMVVDSLIPPEVAEKAEALGVRKSEMDTATILYLAIMAGGFIGLGSLFYTTVVTGTEPHIGYGLTKLVGGLAFCLGLVLVVVGGAELFTGNNLLIMATVSGRVPISRLLRNWTLVYIGNFIGSLLTAWFIYLSDYHLGASGELGETAVSVAAAKCNLALLPALMRGIYCNALVCLAIWLTYSCRTTGDKILAIIFPITAFVAAGFEHCVANMYFIPLALFIADGSGQSVPGLTWGNFLVGNLLPVTIGNIIGGAGFVGGLYWLSYRRHAGRARPAD